MIYTVTLNPAIDYTIKVTDYKKGAVNRTSYENISAGGKGINVSAVLSRLGAETEALGFCGGFTGKMLIQMLEDMNIKNSFIDVKNGITRINVKLNADSAETEINGSGPDISSEYIEQLYQKLEKLHSDDFLVIAGSIPKSLPSDIYFQIMKKVQNIGVKVVIDASGDLLMKSLELKPFLIKPNNFELGEIFGTTIYSREKALVYARKLQEKGALNVIVSLAEEGAVFVCETGEEYSLPAPRGKVINSVGAGDSMVAGFIYGYTSLNSFEDAFKLGISSGSATAFSDFLAQKDDIIRIFDSFK